MIDRTVGGFHSGAVEMGEFLLFWDFLSDQPFRTDGTAEGTYQIAEPDPDAVWGPNGLTGSLAWWLSLLRRSPKTLAHRWDA